MRWFKTMLPLIDRVAPALVDRSIAVRFSRPRRTQVEHREPDPLGSPIRWRVNGEELAVWTAGSGRPVILIHGWEASHRDFDAYAKALLNMGFQVIGVDLPGHGKSTGETLNIPQIADVLEFVVDHLCGGDAAGIIAHSLGGAGTIIALARRGWTIPTVLLAAPSKAKTYLLNLLNALGFGPSRYERVRVQYRKLFGLDLEDLDASLDSPRVRAQVLLIYGNRDRMVPSNEGLAYQSVLGRGRLVFLENIGHRSILKEPAAIACAVSFLADQGHSRQTIEIGTGLRARAEEGSASPHPLEQQEPDVNATSTTLPTRQNGLILALFVIVSWMALSATLAANGVFSAAPSQPPLAMLLAIAVPPAIFATAIATVPSFRRWVLEIDSVFLTAIQALRVVGAGFLFLYAFGHLPGLFAIPAGWGDVLVGVLAPFAAAALAANRDFLRSRRLELFHYLGLLDFVGAIGSGVLARGSFFPVEPTTSALGQLPLSLIPGFAVPLWICLHIAALTQIRAARAARAGRR